VPNASQAISERTKALWQPPRHPENGWAHPRDPAGAAKRMRPARQGPGAQFAAIGLPMGLSGPVSMPQGAKTLAPAFVSNHVSVLRKWARVSPAISAVAIVAERAFAA